MTSGGLGTMGYGLPAAIGTQLGNPDGLVIDVAGEASILMNIQEMSTAVQYNLPVKIFILNNQWMGMVRQWQEQFYDKNYSGVDLKNPDFVMLAQSFGIKAVRVETVEEMKAATLEAKNYDGPYLIHAVVPKEENVFPMVAPQTSLSETIYYPEN